MDTNMVSICIDRPMYTIVDNDVDYPIAFVNNLS